MALIRSDGTSVTRIPASALNSAQSSAADNLRLTYADAFADVVLAGLIFPTSTTLASTMTAGTAEVLGTRVVVAATAYTFAASQDTYVDLSSAGVLTYVAVALAAAAPAVTANSLRLQKVVTNATAVTSVGQIASRELTANRNVTVPAPTAGGHAATKKYADDGLATKQATLVSGTNIKTINDGSLLGDGNLTIGLLYHSEARSIAAPNATVPVHSLTPIGAEADIDFALKPKGTGAITAHVADGTATGGNKRGSNAVDFQTSRGAADQVASGAYAFLGGGYNNKPSGYAATVGGGFGNIASRVGSFIGGGANNGVTNWSYGIVVGGEGNDGSGDWAFVGGGRWNSAGGSQAVACGGQSNAANGERAVIVGGLSNTNGGKASFIGGGEFNDISGGSYGFIPGGYYGSTRGLYGASAHASGRFAATGDSQELRMVLRRQTTDATTTELSANGSNPTAETRYTPFADSSATVRVKISGRDSTGADVAGWEFLATIKAVGGALTLVATTTVHAASTAGASTWAAALGVTAGNAGLEVRVTGQAAKTINWTARVEATETR